jgi:ADP-ribosylglycohydrolase
MNANDTRNLPVDHNERVKRAMLSFNGLSAGDGFGECFFTSTEIIQSRLREREVPPAPWIVTDDTMMALSIVRCLKQHGSIEQDWLARAFASEYARDPNRGYGGMAQQILRVIGQGTSWKAVSRMVFDGQGSCGNGGAMRAAPIGAYFADDPLRVIREAKMSAEITHAHPDGQTGAVSVALAAAWMVVQSKPNQQAGYDLIEFVLDKIAQTETYDQLKKVLTVPLTLDPRTAALILGNGSRVVAWDTVPFCLWCAARHKGDYAESLWNTVAGLGDRDTTCAIVGGIVSSGASAKIPEEWLAAREEIKV